MTRRRARILGRIGYYLISPAKLTYVERMEGLARWVDDEIRAATRRARKGRRL